VSHSFRRSWCLREIISGDSSKGMSGNMKIGRSLVELERIKRLIYLIGGQRVILAADLASLYRVVTWRLNEQVKRNKDRFPEDFVFQLTAKEDEALTSQIARSKSGRGGRRRLGWSGKWRAMTSIFGLSLTRSASLWRRQLHLIVESDFTVNRQKDGNSPPSPSPSHPPIDSQWVPGGEGIECALDEPRFSVFHIVKPSGALRWSRQAKPVTIAGWWRFLA
jgi:hypothetical protein